MPNVSQTPNDDIPVYKVKDIETNVVKLKHRNQLLPLYKSQNLVTYGTKLRPKQKKDQHAVIDLSARNHGAKPDKSSSDENDEDCSSDSSIELEFKRDSEPDDHDEDDDQDSSDNESSEEEQAIVNRPEVYTRYGRLVKPPDRYQPG